MLLARVHATSTPIVVPKPYIPSYVNGMLINPQPNPYCIQSKNGGMTCSSNIITIKLTICLRNFLTTFP